MKIGLSIAIFLSVAIGSARADDFARYMELGKAEFKKDIDERDYSLAAKHLEKAVKLKPKSAEAHYFLGYAYSRMNSDDGRKLIFVNRELTEKSSAEFELVNRLQPKYKGEIVSYDPYSKITCEWTSLAISYWYAGKLDSAKWAFEEGRRRGGFSEFLLAYHRALLDECSKNAILMSSGDASTFPLWYLQFIENYRSDVAVVDISLLNTEWYPNFLVRTETLDFGMTQPELDSLVERPWKDTITTIGDFTWTVKANTEDNYMLRSGLLLLNLLKTYRLDRDLFFSYNFKFIDMLNLQEHLIPIIIGWKVNFRSEPAIPSDIYYEYAKQALPIARKANPNCIQEVYMVEDIRYNFIAVASDLAKAGDIDKAREIFKLIDKYAPERIYPYQEASWKEDSDKLRKWLFK